MAAKAKAKKRSTDIPLDNIPERPGTRKAYTSEFKKAAADRVIAGEVADAVARELGVPSSSVIHGWVAKVRAGQPLTGGGAQKKTAHHAPEDNVAAVLKSSLARALKGRNERLEAAACIVEADAAGREGDDLAKKIRAYKRE